MAFGSQAKRCGMILLAAAAMAAAQNTETSAVEKRPGRDRPGRLAFRPDRFEFQPLKGGLRAWPYQEMRRLELTAEGEVRVTLYRDLWWQAARDQRIRLTLMVHAYLAGACSRTDAGRATMNPSPSARQDSAAGDPSSVTRAPSAGRPEPMRISAGTCGAFSSAR